MAAPDRHTVFVTPAGITVTGFARWRQLRAAYPRTGPWPVLMDHDTPSRLAHRYFPGDPVPDDGAADLAGHGARPAGPARPDLAPLAGPCRPRYGGWNDYPMPGPHTAILRHRHGAEPVLLTGDTVELALTAPPRSRSASTSPTATAPPSPTWAAWWD
ncbi:hypothetical protein [Actinophytocola sp.]|uniref:hypothetical protein n=1 Tax=Actinophytocola sp. TaxID=1872138 RepID=UPI002D80B8A0|nr:hypothetical protein [Actinophytocola sp.]HET9140231.1 hypothetical protein [Actinophytocola sp.]